AEILGIDPDTYRKYEIGTAIPSEEEIETLANIYNVSPDRLTGEFDIMKFINLRQSIDLIGSYLMRKSCCFCNFHHAHLHIFALCHEIFSFIPKGSN
ncbi:MAG: helix-turn-helix domain-containing protein, partial [Clostridiales bacterium]|nr:helix-turn-helix domain-containing protein [Clostridiales bacterium]